MKKGLLQFLLMIVCGALAGLISMSATTYYHFSKDVKQSEKTSAKIDTGLILKSEIEHYYESRLEEKDKIIYRQMYEAIANNRIVKIDTTDEEKIKEIYTYLVFDHPEFFYCSSYRLRVLSVFSKPLMTEFIPGDVMDEEVIRTYSRKIQEYTDQCLLGIDPKAGDYEKIKYIYDYIIYNTDYELGCENSQNISSVFVNKKSVCMGYAMACAYLLQRCGIECAVVDGTADGNGHAWNLVKADGEWYYVDCTWGDAQFQSDDARCDFENWIAYDYLLVTSDQLFTTHKPGRIEMLPECTSIDDNYFYKENLYLSDYNPSDFIQIIRQRMDKGEKKISIMCASSDICDQIIRAITTDSILFTEIEGITEFSYYRNNDLNIVSISIQ